MPGWKKWPHRKDETHVRIMLARLWAELQTSRLWVIGMSAPVLVGAAALGSRASTRWSILLCLGIGVPILIQRPVMGLFALVPAALIVTIEIGSGTEVALGTPVVSTSKGAEGLEVTHGRDILIADEPAEFAAQVVRLLRDGALRRELAAEARRTVEGHYDWEQTGQDFVDLIEEVAGSRAGGVRAS